MRNPARTLRALAPMAGRGPGLHRLRRQPHHAAAGTQALLAFFFRLLSLSLSLSLSLGLSLSLRLSLSLLNRNRNQNRIWQAPVCVGGLLQPQAPVCEPQPQPQPQLYTGIYIFYLII